MFVMQCRHMVKFYIECASCGKKIPMCADPELAEEEGLKEGDTFEPGALDPYHLCYRCENEDEEEDYMLAV